MPAVTTPGTPFTRYLDSKKSRPSLVGLLAEGDSWFAYPEMITTNIIAQLRRANEGKATILSLAKNGDEAREMLCAGQYSRLHKLLSDPRLLDNPKLQFDGILYSGGGNDIVGVSMLPLLNNFRKGMEWLDCIQMDRFERRLQGIELAYHELADLRDDFAPKATIFTHSYDYATPTGRPLRILFMKIGPWIRSMQEQKGIVNPEFQKRIIDHMLSRFDDLQRRLEQARPPWNYVRTQGTLADNEWDNELHPTTVGFVKMKDKFQSALASVFTSLA